MPDSASVFTEVLSDARDRVMLVPVRQVPAIGLAFGFALLLNAEVRGRAWESDESISYVDEPYAVLHNAVRAYTGVLVPHADERSRHIGRPDFVAGWIRILAGDVHFRCVDAVRIQEIQNFVQIRCGEYDLAGERCGEFPNIVAMNIGYLVHVRLLKRRSLSIKICPICCGTKKRSKKRRKDEKENEKKRCEKREKEGKMIFEKKEKDGKR